MRHNACLDPTIAFGAGRMDGKSDPRPHNFGKWISEVIGFLLRRIRHFVLHHYEREHEVTALRWAIRDPTSHRHLGRSQIKLTRP